MGVEVVNANCHRLKAVELMVGMNEQSPGKQTEGLVNFFKVTPLTPGLDICYRCT